MKTAVSWALKRKATCCWLLRTSSAYTLRNEVKRTLTTAFQYGGQSIHILFCKCTIHQITKMKQIPEEVNNIRDSQDYLKITH